MTRSLICRVGRFWELGKVLGWATATAEPPQALSSRARPNSGAASLTTVARSGVFIVGFLITCAFRAAGLAWEMRPSRPDATIDEHAAISAPDGSSGRRRSRAGL